MKQENEHLSVLLDAYSDDDHDRSVLDDAIGDINQQYTLRRYQLIGEAMRRELPERIQVDFAAVVRSRIAQEPAFQAVAGKEPVTRKPSLWSFWFRPAAGMAVAATVAVVAVSLLQPSEQPGERQITAQTQNETEARVQQLAQLPVITPNMNNAVKVSAAAPSVRSPLGTQWKINRGEPATQNKLNTYLINHNEYAGSMQGIIPQVRVVGFDVNQ